LEFDPEENRVKEPGKDAYPLFARLEFNKLIDRFGLAPSAEPESGEVFEVQCTMETLSDPSAVSEAARAMEARGETVCVRASSDLSLVVFSQDTAAYIMEEAYSGDYIQALNSLMALPKAGHEVKDLCRALLEKGVEPGEWVFDSALAAYLLDATAGHYDLDRLCLKYCGFQIGRASDTEADQLSLLDQEKFDRAKGYADLAAEAAAIACLQEKLEPLLKENDLWELFQTAELPLCRVLAEMERAGFQADRTALAQFGQLLSVRIGELEESIYTLAGEEFNINSPKQLGEILFGKLGLPHGKKTKTGWSTNADVLEKLRFQAPIVEQVLEYRQLAKLKSTYADGLLKAMDDDSRVRTSFQMTVTATGRLSSTEPNLQNIPTRTDLGSEIRRMFVAQEGWMLVDADYSQIELRLLAHISGDQAMIDAFLSGEDFHTVTAAHVFGVPTEAVTGAMRRAAKAVNFGIVYGISAFSLSQDLGVPVAEAKEYMETYFARFPGVKAYMENVVASAKEKGYVETLFHRRRALPELTSSNHNMRSFGERVALNMPIQGAAADIIKLAMVRVYDRLKREGLQARLIMQVHDELIVECPEGETDRVEALLTEEMEGVVQLAVPLTAQAHSGKNWLEAKD
jgi:DNA polymerase-1